MKRLIVQTNNTDPAYALQRQWCRQTWLHDARFIDNLRWFFYGGNTENPDADSIICDARDGKNTCSDRHRYACREVLKDPTWNVLWKCDSDSYVHLPRLMAHPAPGDFGGYVIPSDGVRGGYPSGALVWYSRRAAQIIADNLIAGCYADDLEIGKLLRQHGIEPVHEPRIHSWLDWSLDTPIPEPHNDVISTHAVRTWDDHLKVHQRRLGVA